MLGCFGGVFLGLLGVLEGVFEASKMFFVFFLIF